MQCTDADANDTAFYVRRQRRARLGNLRRPATVETDDLTGLKA